MRIFVDMDDVIADTYAKHLELYNNEFNEALKKEDCHTGEVWENVPVDRQDSVHQQIWKPGFFRNLDPILDSQIVMKELSEKHEVYIASAAMQFPNSLKEKSDWLDAYFPFISWQKRILCGDKYMLQGDLLIDDRAYNLESFKGDTLLFSSPHNTPTNGFKRVESWQEVGKFLL